MTEIATPSDVLNYWFETLTTKDWYVANDAVDATIRDRFMTTWEAARRGACDDWATSASGAMALLVVTDQFPRNMFRGDGRSFATDDLALRTARSAIAQGWDLETPEPDRQFFYMPFMHAEDLVAQNEAIDFVKTRMPETGDDNIDHAHAHHWVIAKFGRFPYRNEALDRTTTDEEQAFLDAGGYGHALAEVRKAD